MDVNQKKNSLKTLIILTFAHVSLVLFCETTAIFFTQFLVASTLINSSLPSDFTKLTEEDRKIVYQQELEQLTKDLQENSQKVIAQYYAYTTKDAPWILLIERILWLMAFLPPAYVVIHKFFRSPLTNFSTQPTTKELLLGISLAILTFIALNLFFISLEKMGHKVEMNIVNKTLLNGIKGNLLGYLWALYSVGIVTGIIEEIYFRGYLLHQFLHFKHEKYGLVLTSLIFGLMHHSPGSSPLIALSLSFVGLVFGIVYMKTKNIWVASLCHVTYNSLVLTIGFFFGAMS